MKTYLLPLVALLTLASCLGGMFERPLTTEEKIPLVVTLGEALRTGQITKAQHDAALEAINQHGVSINDLLLQGSEILVTLILGYFGIRVWRGPVGDRKGIEPQVQAKV